MPRYDYQTSYFHKRSTARRVHVIALVGLVVATAMAGWVGFDWLRERLRKDSPTSESTSVTIQSQAVTSFRSSYFEFQADEAWQEIVSENRPNRFVYRRFDGPLVTDDLVIEIGTSSPKSLAETTSTRVLGARVNSDGSLVPEGLVSAHCKEVYPDTSTALPKIVQLNGVNFMCNPNSNQYDVWVGMVNGDTELKINRPSGEVTSYYIEYKSLETNPQGNRLIQLLSTFKSR